MTNFAISEDTKVRTLALKVKDLDTMYDFYHDVMGLVSLREENDMIFMGTEEDKNELLILELDSDNDSDHQNSNLFHFAFLLPTHEDLMMFYSHVKDLGLTFEEANDYGTCEALYIADPEGNLVEICVNHPKERITASPVGKGVKRGTPIDLSLFRQQGSIQFKVTPCGTTVGHVHFNVSNLDSLIDFYTNVLGFISIDDVCSDTKLTPSYSTLNFIAANEFKEFSQETKDIEDNQKVDFVVFEMNDEFELDALRHHLSEIGEKFFYNKGKKIVQVIDPYGVRLWFIVRNNASKNL